MENRRVETEDGWRDFAERIGAMAREEGLLGIIVAGFTPVDANGMEIHLSMMNSPNLCTHDKLGMRLKTIEKLALTAFEKLLDEPHHHDENSDDGESDEGMLQ